MEIEQALKNYKNHLSLPENDFKKPQNGSTWFNNWHDWIEYKTSVVENSRQRYFDKYGEWPD